jgi:splicing factor 3B subunit 2
MTSPQLKALAPCPEVVEFEDVTGPDPVFLVNLKSCPNTVPVPGHWSQKRKYLAGKRGFLKAPYQLPSYIKETGIVEQRSALRAREESMSMGAKARDKINPRLGKLDLDYELMYNAFFKWQTKPEMSVFGEIYYEGKEFEVRLRDKKPGILSDELKEALGMTVLAPPPYLYNMQRFGPPPSYYYLKIPGLSAPISQGCQWGFHPGGWGKPPLDPQGQPLYGDVYGVGTLLDQQGSTLLEVEDADKRRWGVLIPEEEPMLPPPPPPPQQEQQPELEPQEERPIFVEEPRIILPVVQKPIQRPPKQEIKRESVKEKVSIDSEDNFKF